MRLIGLTGGIGMGKSTISDYLAQTYQLPVLDADHYARSAVEPGSTILSQIVERYGPELLLADGTLDRRQLGNRIFDQPPERVWLEQQIHPYVRHRFYQELRMLSSHTAVLAIPLLFEAQMTDLVTEIWVVFCSLDQQQARLLQALPGASPAHIQARIASQWPIADKMAQADVVLDNSTSREALFRQVDWAYHRQGTSLNIK